MICRPGLEPSPASSRSWMSLKFPMLSAKNHLCSRISVPQNTFVLVENKVQTFLGIIHKWRHANFNFFDPKSPICHASMYYALCTSVTHSQPPSSYLHDINYRRFLIRSRAYVSQVIPNKCQHPANSIIPVVYILKLHYIITMLKSFNIIPVLTFHLGSSTEQRSSLMQNNI